MEIKIENINKIYNKRDVLKNFSLIINQPGIYPVIGPSGSGKTTLLKIVSGLITPDQGGVFYDGKNIFELSFNQRARLRNEDIGFIFQDHFLEENFSCIENVLLPIYIQKKKSKTELQNIGIEALKQVGLEKQSEQLASTLSGGEAQRIAIARAIVNHPKVIFADEPTGNLDTENGETVMNILEEISKDKIVFLVTHNLEIAKRYHKAIEIKDGIRINHD